MTMGTRRPGRRSARAFCSADKSTRVNNRAPGQPFGKDSRSLGILKTSCRCHETTAKGCMLMRSVLAMFW
jgi:hypothetical protein